MTHTKVNVTMVSLLQYLGAILVILLHCKRVFDSPVLHFVQKSLFSRLVVPYFMVVSAYFFRQKEETEGLGLKAYVRQQLPRYLLWSLIYSPFALYYYLSLGYPVAGLPLAAFVALLYTGFGYQLWFLPALVQGLWLVRCLWKRFGVKWSVAISLVLYLFGMVETYSAYLSGTVIGKVFQSYQPYFLTTRNGLFYAPIFICLGFLSYDWRDKVVLNGRFYRTWLVFSLLFMAEAWVIFQRQGHDKNFFFFLVPWLFFLFNWSLKTSCLQGRDLKQLRVWSRGYYFSHVLFVELGFLLLSTVPVLPYRRNLMVFIFSFVMSHFLTYLVGKPRKRILVT